MKKLGLMVDSWGPSDVAFDALYSVQDAPRELDIVGFYITPARACINPRCALMEGYLSYCFDGTLVATSLHTADRVKKAATSKDRWWYLWSLPQLEQRMPFLELYDLFHSLKLVARTQKIADSIEKIWGVNVKVAKNFRELIKIVGGTDGE